MMESKFSGASFSRCNKVHLNFLKVIFFLTLIVKITGPAYLKVQPIQCLCYLIQNITAFIFVDCFGVRLEGFII